MRPGLIRARAPIARAPYLTKYPYNYPFRFTVAEIDDLSLMQTDLLSYILKTEAGWIANGGIDEQWDAYLAQLKNLKVDKYVEMYKTSYARSMKK
jgi:putative aldouronate transport system substrate-binding protein